VIALRSCSFDDFSILSDTQKILTELHSIGAGAAGPALTDSKIITAGLSGVMFKFLTFLRPEAVQDYFHLRPEEFSCAVVLLSKFISQVHFVVRCGRVRAFQSEENSSYDGAAVTYR
jgi:hypothetical protein